MSDADIVNIAWLNGGRRFLATLDEDCGTDKLRGAITAFAEDGNAAVVNQTIASLFGQSDAALSDGQVGQLAERLVEDYSPS